MSRNRIIYQSEGIFVGQKSPCTGVSYTATDVKEIYRVQSANYSFNLGRRDVSQFGELAPIDRISIDPPTVSLDFTYLVASVYNEQALGFNVGASSVPTNSIFTGIFGGTSDQKTYWLKTVAYGTDLHGLANTGYAFGVIGFGNAYMSSYSLDAAVGDFPRASVRVEAANIKFDNWTNSDSSASTPNILLNGALDAGQTYVLCSGSQNTAATDKTSVCKPGDITFSWDTNSQNALGASITDAKIQSFTLSTDIGRTPLQKLGNAFPFSQEVNFPVNCSLRVTAAVGDMNTGSLPALIADTGRSTLGIKLKGPGGTNVNMGFELRGCQLESQEYSSSIGDSKTVTLTWSTPIGGANDVTRGIWMSGVV